ncbi:neuronal acetylcholine receptor subunit beta-4-like [Saccoglossus kowalevskii]
MKHYLIYTFCCQEEKNQLIKTIGWTQQEWRDEKLHWNPADHSNINQIVIPVKDLWTPNIMLDNSANGEYEIPKIATAVLSHDGNVTYSVPVIFVTPCILDIRYFPFDSQQCQLKFGPWDRTRQEIVMNLKHDAIDNTKYINNSEWDWVKSTAIITDDNVDGDGYSLVTYTIFVERRPLYYVINILLPSIAMALLSALVLCLPPESGEKMSFGVSILVATSVFGVLVSDITPATSDHVPLLIQFLMFNLFLVTVSICVSVAVLQVYHRSSYNLKMPSSIRLIFMKILPKALFMKPFALTWDTHKVHVEPRKDRPSNTAWTLEDISRNEHTNNQSIPTSELQRHDGIHKSVTLLQEILDELRHFRTSVKAENVESEMLAEWRYVAKVVDRLFFVMAVFSYLIGAIVIFSDRSTDEV